MKKYKRTGDAVDVPALGLTNVTPGTTVEASPEQAAGLDGQDGWEHVPDPKRVRAGKKAATKKAPPKFVGEQGPELVNLPPGTTIVPSKES